MGENIGPGSCTNSVCYEAHLELAGALLARGRFERFGRTITLAITPWHPKYIPKYGH